MTTYSVQPLNYINENLFTEIPNWEIPHGQACTLYFQLMIDDALGTRRFLPPVSSQVKLQFISSRPPTVGSASTNISKFAAQILPSADKSLYQVVLMPTETSKIITGGVQLIVTINGSEMTFSQPYMVKKLRSEPGF